MADRPPTPSEARAIELYNEGWRVISRRHRMIARLPPNETGIAALKRASGQPVRMPEEYAADSYRSSYARREGFQDTATMAVIVALARITINTKVAALPARKRGRRA